MILVSIDDSYIILFLTNYKMYISKDFSTWTIRSSGSDEI